MWDGAVDVGTATGVGAGAIDGADLFSLHHHVLERDVFLKSVVEVVQCRNEHVLVVLRLPGDGQ